MRKADGELRPRIESWANVASHLDRFVSLRLGKKVASEITKHDIATPVELHRRGQAGQAVD